MAESIQTEFIQQNLLLSAQDKFKQTFKVIVTLIYVFNLVTSLNLL